MENTKVSGHAEEHMSRVHCQSCGMPMNTPEDFGTGADGSPCADYCCHCRQNGEFTDNGTTLAEAIEGNIPFIIEAGEAKTEEEARAMLQEFMPTLKRWKKTGMIISFKLKDGANADDFLSASDKLQESYLSKCKGFITRQLMLINGVWTDWVIWETLYDAENSMSKSEENEAVKAFASLIGETIEYNFYPLERSYSCSV